MRLSALASTAVSLVVLGVGAQAQSVEERARKDELVFMGSEEPAMRRAFERARASLDEFLEKAKNPSASAGSFSLKVAVREGANIEYFWVSDFSEKEGQFTGTIGNEARMVKTVRFGQRYVFPRSHIVDWTYIDKAQRRMVGNFTMCALLTKEPPAEAEAVKKRFGLSCE